MLTAEGGGYSTITAFTYDFMDAILSEKLLPVPKNTIKRKTSSEIKSVYNMTLYLLSFSVSSSFCFILYNIPERACKTLITKSFNFSNSFLSWC